MTDDPELARLQDEYKDWRIHYRRDTGAYVAWQPGAGLSSHRRDTTVAGLRAQLPPADDLAVLRERFPGWEFEARWITAGSSPDKRRLFGRRGGVTVQGWTAEDVSAAIERGG